MDTHSGVHRYPWVGVRLDFSLAGASKQVTRRGVSRPRSGTRYGLGAALEEAEVYACTLANATSACTAHACAISSCNAGYLDCDDDPSDGCETLGSTCPPPHTIFITSTTTSAVMGGYAGADSLCAAAATAASLPGTFLAWISDGSTTPASRFTQSTVPYALVDGTIVADNWSGLVSGNLRHAISLTESGGSPPPPTLGGVCNAWTGTSPAGTAQDGSCTSWSATSDNSCAGNSSLSNGAWSCQCSGAICGGTAALFCVQQ